MSWLGRLVFVTMLVASACEGASEPKRGGDPLSPNAATSLDGNICRSSEELLTCSTRLTKTQHQCAACRTAAGSATVQVYVPHVLNAQTCEYEAASGQLRASLFCTDVLEYCDNLTHCISGPLTLLACDDAPKVHCAALDKAPSVEQCARDCGTRKATFTLTGKAKTFDIAIDEFGAPATADGTVEAVKGQPGWRIERPSSTWDTCSNVFTFISLEHRTENTKVCDRFEVVLANCKGKNSGIVTGTRCNCDNNSVCDPNVPLEIFATAATLSL